MCAYSASQQWVLLPGLEAIVERFMDFMARILKAPADPASKGSSSRPFPNDGAFDSGTAFAVSALHVVSVLLGGNALVCTCW